MAYQHGKSLTMTIAGVTLPCTSKQLSEMVDKTDVTDDSSSGIQCVLAGIARADFTVDGFLQTSQAYHASSLLRAGNNATITMTVSSGKTYTVGVMVEKVNSIVPVNGAVAFNASCCLNGLQAGFTYPS